MNITKGKFFPTEMNSMTTNNNNIFLFVKNEDKYQSNALKCFHAFFGQIKEKRPYRYAYASEKPNPITGATTLESICIERASSISIHGKEIYSKDILSTITNPYINALINILGDLNKVPCFNENKEYSKISELVRAFTTTTSYILLEAPETFLSDQSFLLIKKAIAFEVKTKNILISSNSAHIWHDVSMKTVIRDQNGQFHISKSDDEFHSQGIIEESLDSYKKAA